MPATGFQRVGRKELSDEYHGRVWRVNLSDETAVSQGNKGVESIVFTGTGIVVRRSHGRTTYRTEDVDSVLVEDEQPTQRTIAAWGGS